MKMKKIISLLFIICTILVVAGCGSSKSKFEGTWYGVKNFNLYKVEITKNDKNEHLIKTYTSKFDTIEKDYENKIKTEKWTGYKLLQQDIATVHDENTLVINHEIMQEVVSLNKNNELEGVLIGISLINDKQTTEKEMLEKAKEGMINFNNKFKYKTKFAE